MRAFLDGELRRIEAQSAASSREAVARVEQAERQRLGKLDETTHTPSASVGEIEDKLDRLLPRPST